MWWRKVKKKVSKKLGIDENAGKEVEEDIVISDEKEENKSEEDKAPSDKADGTNSDNK